MAINNTRSSHAFVDEDKKHMENYIWRAVYQISSITVNDTVVCAGQTIYILSNFNTFAFQCLDARADTHSMTQMCDKGKYTTWEGVYTNKILVTKANSQNGRHLHNCGTWAWRQCSFWWPIQSRIAKILRTVDANVWYTKKKSKTQTRFAKSREPVY